MVKVSVDESSSEGEHIEQTLKHVDEVREQLRRTSQPISQAEKAARQDRIRLERAADDLDRTYDNLCSLRKTSPCNLEPFLVDIDAMVSSASVSGDAAGRAYDQMQEWFTDVRSLTTGAIASAGTANYISVEAYSYVRANNDCLDPQPPGTRRASIFLEEAATDDQKELEALLSGLTPHLAEKLRGARAALASNEPDAIAQAYTSMQELLDQTLHHFSDEMIAGIVKDGRLKKASWFSNLEDGVTRAHRIRFMVQGTSPTVDSETERRIQDLIRQAKLLGSIQEEKHRHGSNAPEQPILGRTHLAALEAFLLYLLRSHRAKSHQWSLP